MVSPITLVIPAFNRPEALARLLKSLEKSDFENEGGQRIIFSLEKGSSENIKGIINDWSFGKVEKVIYQNETYLGVDAHLLKCGSFSLDEGNVVILEDDSLVAPHFMKYCQYTLEQLDRYGTEKLGGISLYEYEKNYQQTFFYPSLSHCFYLQKASTRGQLFTPHQWQAFEDWRQSNPGLREIDPKAPLQIRQYSDYNWEKLYNYYLIDTNRYFLYPPWSYSTNFGELGEHVKRRSEENAFQVPLQIGETLPEIEPFEDSHAVYDAFFELLPSRIKQLNSLLEPYDFEVDLYGSKPFDGIDRPYVLSCKKAENPEMTFGRNLKPHELNIAYDIEGDDFFLAKKETFHENFFDKWRRELRTHYYHYPDVSLTKALKMKLLEVLSRIFGRLIK